MRTSRASSPAADACAGATRRSSNSSPASWPEAARSASRVAANPPDSTRREYSTSSAPVRSGTRPISLRYIRTGSEVPPLLRSGDEATRSTRPAGGGRAGGADAAELGAVLLEVAGGVGGVCAASCSSASTEGGGAPGLDGQASRSSIGGDGLVERDALGGQQGADAFDDLGRELLVAERQDDLVHRDRPSGPAPCDELAHVLGALPGVERRRRVGHAPSSSCCPTKATNSSAASTAASGSRRRSMISVSHCCSWRSGPGSAGGPDAAP